MTIPLIRLAPRHASLRHLVAMLALTLVAGCSWFSNKDAAPSYRTDKIDNPLEIPPDLSPVAADPGTTIPGARTIASSTELNEFQNFKKLQDWSTFEEFQKWKLQQDNSGLDFQTFLNEQHDKNASAYLYTPTDGVPELRVVDSPDSVWHRVGVAMQRMNVSVLESSAADLRYRIRHETPAAKPASVVEKVKSWFGAAGEILNLRLVDAGTYVSIVAQAPAGVPTDPASIKSLFNAMEFQLDTYAARPELGGAVSAAAGDTALMVRDADGALTLQVVTSPDTLWRRVGHALSSGGFTIEARDPAADSYRIRYIDPDHPPKKHGLSRLAFWNKDINIDDAQTLYMVRVAPTADGRSTVSVHSALADNRPIEERILGLIRENLAGT